MLKKIDHIGIAVHSIEKSRSFYEEVLGLTCNRVEEVESQKVRVAFFKIGETAIELLEPTDSTSPIHGFIQKYGEGVHHVAYLSDNVREQLACAEEKGYKLIHETPIPGAGGKEIAFLHPSSTNGVLTEICSTL
jgi:methylmalonyl-CoA epimerase